MEGFVPQCVDYVQKSNSRESSDSNLRTSFGGRVLKVALSVLKSVELGAH